MAGIPDGVVCKRCGAVLGVMLSPAEPELPPEALCCNCIREVSQELGITPKTGADWDRIRRKLDVANY
jgi:hypothetical protein